VTDSPNLLHNWVHCNDVMTRSQWTEQTAFVGSE